MSRDIVDRLRIDPGTRTVGELLQDRESALHEIMRLREQLELARKGCTPPPAGIRQDPPANTAYRAGSMLRLTELCELLSISRSTIYNRVAEGSFPEPVRIGERMVRWPIEAIQAWQQSRVSASRRVR